MLSVAVARHLHAAGLVVYGRAGADCFLEGWRPQPAGQVALFMRPGRAGTSGGDGWDWPGVQALVRADRPDHARTSYERAVGLRDALHGLSHQWLDRGGPDEVWVTQLLATTSAPVSLGADTEGRLQWSVTFDGEVRNATALRP